jgi:hypothetical protein
MPCHNCNKCGHWARQCPEPDRRKLVKSKDNKKISEDADTPTKADNYKSDNVVKKKKIKKGKGANKVAYSTQVIVSKEPDYYYGDDYEEDTFDVNCYAISASVMHTHSVSRNDPRAVALDSFANHTFGCNEDLFKNIKNKRYSLNGVTGSTVGNRMGWLPCFGAAVITPESNCNAIAMHDAERYRVEYFQRDRYVVHVSKDLQLNFLHDVNSKAYICIFTDEILDALRDIEDNDLCMNINHASCTENESLYLKSEVRAARNARQ